MSLQYIAKLEGGFFCVEILILKNRDAQIRHWPIIRLSRRCSNPGWCL